MSQSKVGRPEKVKPRYEVQEGMAIGTSGERAFQAEGTALTRESKLRVLEVVNEDCSCGMATEGRGLVGEGIRKVV